MDAIIARQVEKLEAYGRKMDSLFGDRFGVFKDEIFLFVKKEINEIISILSETTPMKGIRLEKMLWQLRGIEITINNMQPKRFGRINPFSVSLFVLYLKGIQESIIKIIRNL